MQVLKDTTKGIPPISGAQVHPEDHPIRAKSPENNAAESVAALPASTDPAAKANSKVTPLPAPVSVLMPAGDETRLRPFLNPSSLTPDASVTPITSVTSRKHSFLSSFPAEIRLEIYNFACHWPDFRPVCASFNREIEEYYAARSAGIVKRFPIWRGRVQTPTILLLCRQITKECRPIFDSRFLVIDRLPPGSLTGLVTRATLQAVKHLDIRFTVGDGSGIEWVKIIRELVQILLEKNSLKELHIKLCVAPLDKLKIWRKDMINMKHIKDEIDQLRTQCLKRWPMKKIKGEVWLTEGREAHRVALFPFGQSALSYPQALRFFEVRERSYRIVRREDRMVLETFEWCGDRLAVPPKDWVLDTVFRRSEDETGSPQAIMVYRRTLKGEGKRAVMGASHVTGRRLRLG